MSQVLPNSRIESRVFDPPAPLRLWHLASFDAPTVALVWSLSFAWVAHVRLPLWAPVLLTLAVWAVYIADRLLDARAGLRNQTLHRLHDRHLFHWRHRRILLPLALSAAVAATWIIFALMPVIARERNSILAAASLVYFTRVHTGRRPSPFISKELLVGLLFTAGCALPAFSRAAFDTHNPLWPLLIPVSFFALLAWLNCYSIDRWESEQSTQMEEHSIGSKGTAFSLKGTGFSPYMNPTKQVWALAPEGNSQAHASRHRIFPIGTLLSITALFLAAILSSHPRSAILLLAASLAALLLALLDKLRNRLAPVALRATADLVLLTPILLIPIAPLLK